LGLALELVVKKIADHQRSNTEFVESLQQRIEQLQTDPSLQSDFEYEMCRFLPPDIAKRTVENPQFWIYVRNTAIEAGQQMLRFLDQGASPSSFYI
jgi:hypothetical protein